MKKFLALLLSAGMVFAVASCSKSNEGDKPNDGQENPDGDNPQISEYACLNGTDYYVFEMDEVTFSKIANRVTVDLRVDDTTTHIWYWTNGGALTALECIGPNCFGEEGWFATGIDPNRPEGWFGLGLAFDAADYAAAANEKKAKLAGITRDHVVRFAMKSRQAGNYAFTIFDAVVGIGNQEGAYIDFPRDGEWHEIEIPVAELMAMNGFNLENPGNLFAFTQANDSWPVDINLSGMFIYKK